MDAVDTGQSNGIAHVVYGERWRMPNTRKSFTHDFEVGDFHGTIVAGVHEDGTLGEIFLHNVGKQGSTIDGFIQAFAITFSAALQHGASVDDLCRKLGRMKFEPSGFARGIPEINKASSLIAYICTYLVMRFGSRELADELRSELYA